MTDGYKLVLAALALVLAISAWTLLGPDGAPGTVNPLAPQPVAASALKQGPAPEGPCAGLTLDAQTLAWVFAPAVEEGAETPSAVLTSDSSFRIGFDGATYDVLLDDGSIRVSGGDQASADRLAADVMACVNLTTAPADAPNTFGAKGGYGPSLDTQAP